MEERAERAERFRALFEACYGPLQAYARRRVPPGDADDVVAEVLTVAWRRLDDVPADAALPWLYGVARHTLANHRRAGGRRARLFDRLASVRHEPVGEPAVPDDGEPADGVLAALARLRPADREVLRLTAWEGLRPGELAVALACSENAAALRLSRARRRLRSQLAGTTLTGTTVTRTETPWKVPDA